MKDNIAEENGPTTLHPLHAYRMEIDKFINSTKHILTSRETALTHTNLQRAKMWLGKVLGESGSPTPYPQSEDAKSPQIEKQADHSSNSLITEWQEMDETSTYKAVSNIQRPLSVVHIPRVKDFRHSIQLLVDSFKKWNENREVITQWESIYCRESILALEEAKMWLGMELDRIRNSEDYGKEFAKTISNVGPKMDSPNYRQG